MIVRFLAVGLACALLHNAVLIGGDWAGLHYVVSSLVSLVVVTLFGYALHSRFTFRDAERGPASLARYAVTVSANLPLSIAGLFLLVDVAKISVPKAAPIVTGALVVFNFVANRWALRAGRRRA